jgi:hypothetical protein
MEDDSPPPLLPYKNFCCWLDGEEGGERETRVDDPCPGQKEEAAPPPWGDIGASFVSETKCPFRLSLNRRHLSMAVAMSTVALSIAPSEGIFSYFPSPA